MNRLALAILPAILAAPALAGNVAPVMIESSPVPATVATVPLAPSADWTGGYVGAQVSYADVSPEIALLPAVDIDGDGVLYGLRAGYDYQFGGAGVVGGLIQYDRGSIELGTTGVELEDVLRVGLRAGAAAGRNLFYATGGYAQAGTGGAGGGVGSADGYFAGVGYEALVAPRVSLGLEALYHDFGNFDATPAALGDVDATATTVGLNVNFRF